MSLNQKYTWNDFLKANPEHKEKKTKRTSPEGKKAFEAAYKKFIKDYLVERQTMLARMQERITKSRDELTAKVKGFQKAKNLPKAKFYQAKVGIKDAAIANINVQVEHIKVLQKKA
jgi:hypothetical protein